MPDGHPVQGGSVPFEVTDPERIAVQRYYDEEFYKLECERLWPHVWQMACRLEQIQNVGDWIEYSNVGKSVIIVRASDGVKAYQNACRHRGVRLGRGHGNCKEQGFTCPFHGWRYNMDGKNTFVYGKHLFSARQLEEGDLDLVTCRVELWAGCAFINFDDNAPPLRETLGPLAANLEAYQAHKMRAEYWYATVVPANWKTAMEAFMEGYHVMRTHPQLHAAGYAMYNSSYGQDTGGLGTSAPEAGESTHAGPRESSLTQFKRMDNPLVSARENVLMHFKHMEMLGEGMAGMAHAKDVATARGLLDVDLPEDPEQAVMAWYGLVNQEVVKDGRARGEATPDLSALAATNPVKPVEFIWPHYFLLPFLSSMASYRIRPLGQESCLFELWSMTLFPEGKEPPPPMEPTVLPYDSKDFPAIPQQDYSNIPEQQVGLHADGFKYMRLSKDIEGMISNYQRIIDGYLKAPRRTS